MICSFLQYGSKTYSHSHISHRKLFLVLVCLNDLYNTKIYWSEYVKDTIIYYMIIAFHVSVNLCDPGNCGTKSRLLPFSWVFLMPIIIAAQKITKHGIFVSPIYCICIVYIQETEFQTSKSTNEGFILRNKTLVVSRLVKLLRKMRKLFNY